MNEEELELFENIYDLGIGECSTDDIKRAGLIFDKFKYIIEENKELKATLENNSKINVADHKYASEMEDKFLELQQENEKLKNNKMSPDELVSMVSQELVRQNEQLENILNELEKWLEELLASHCDFSTGRAYEDVLDKLQELKEGI